MSTERDIPRLEKKIVVTFDICSSTAIIEDLNNTENTIKWRDFLIWMKNYLRIKSEELDFTIYKFTGDGWILLFDYDYPGDDLISFLKDFCKQFKMRYKKKIEDYLEVPPTISGITFGIERGSLIGFIMNNHKEFIGRALNVACRLQSAIKDRDHLPQYKSLISKPLYQSFYHAISQLEHVEVRRKLRNIAGGKEVHCVKIKLL